MVANARLGSEEHAGRTLLGPVAVVRDRVIAAVSTVAEVRALERLSAASDGRILDGLAAVANPLVEIGDQTAWTRVLVTQVLASMVATVELTVANEHANVIAVAAHLVALVPTARLLLVAASFAHHFVRVQVTLDVMSLLAASTFDLNGASARWTLVIVTFRLANVNLGAVLMQDSLARLLARGNRIRAFGADDAVLD